MKSKCIFRTIPDNVLKHGANECAFSLIVYFTVFDYVINVLYVFQNLFSI